MPAGPIKKCCIIGTAPSFRRTPWSDQTIECWAINDGYALGLPRIDRHYDLHPLDKMWFRPAHQTRILETSVPPGHFVRPEGHLETLKAMATRIPVFLQDTPPPDWPPHAHRFPIEAVHAAFGDSYWASGPSYMLAQAVLEGYTEIWITGIHLATEAEYREQRPQFEQLIGRLLGPTVTESTKDGFRTYDGAVRIVLPVESPLMQHAWKYAYEAKPAPPPNPWETEWKAVKKEKAELLRLLLDWPADQPARQALAKARMLRLEIIEEDIQNQLAKQHMQNTAAILIVPPAGN